MPEYVFKVSTNSTHTRDLRWSRRWLIAVSMMSWSKSNQVYIKHFCRSSMS